LLIVIVYTTVICNDVNIAGSLEALFVPIYFFTRSSATAERPTSHSVIVHFTEHCNYRIVHLGYNRLAKLYRHSLSYNKPCHIRGHWPGNEAFKHYILSRSSVLYH